MMAPFLGNLLSKRSFEDAERLVFCFYSWGVVAIHAAAGARPQIRRAGRLVLDTNLTENERRNALMGFVSALDAKHPPSVCLSWSEGMTFRQLAMPDMPADDLQKAFEWELKKKFFYEPAENHFGFMDVMTVEGAEGPEKLFDVFYCERKGAAGRLSFVQQLGIDIQRLVPAQASLAAFANDALPPTEEDTLICEKDGAAVRIIVTHGDRPMVVRQLTAGGHDDVTDETLARIADEIKKTVDFYEAQKYFRPVRRVLLASFPEPERVLETMTRLLPGMEASLPNVDAYLSPAMPEPEKEVARTSAGHLAAAIGSLMVDEDSMNLAPEDIKSIGRRRRASKKLNATLIAFAAVLCLVFGASWMQVQMLRSELKKLEKEYALISDKKKAFETTLSQERVRRQVIKGTVYAPSFLKEISYHIPPQLVLDELRYIRSDQSLVLKGQVTDTKREGPKSVTLFATNIGQSIFMQSASVSDTHQDEQGILRFEIEGTVKGLL